MLRRLIACMMSVVLLCLPVLAGAEGLGTPTDITPIPTEAPTDAPTETPTEAPTETPTGTPSEAPTEVPTEAPTEIPTETPTEAPSHTPSAAPTEAPTKEPWDESVCDHANVHCAQAPACQVEGCAHIGTDVFGLDYPLCTLGQWLLDQEDRYMREGGTANYALRRSSAALDLNLADVTLWRSGTYVITGGEKRPGAKITIAKDRMVVLTLRGVTADRLILQSNVNLSLDLKEISALQTLEMRQGSVLTLTSGGAMTIAEVARPADTSAEANTKVFITGGSLDAKLNESKGRKLYRFDSAGATAVTVQDKPYQAVTAQEDGSYCLWLKDAETGMVWAAEKQGDTLRVYQKAQGGNQAGALTQGQENTLTQPGTYTLTGTVAAGTRIVIASEQVKLVLSSAVLAQDMTITSDIPYNVELIGVNTAAAGTLLLGKGTATLSGDGSLITNGTGFDAPVNPVGGVWTLGQAPAGWQLYPVSGITGTDQLIVDEQNRALCWNGQSGVYLPTPAQGSAYVLTRENGIVQVYTTKDNKPLYLLSESAQVDAGDAAAFDVQGAGKTVEGAIRAAGAANASANFLSVQLNGGSGAALQLSQGKKLTVNLTGDNALSGAGEPITLTDGAQLTLNCPSGRLLLKGQTNLNGIGLTGNVKVVPEISGSYTKLMLRDASGNPVVNQNVTLRINGQDYAYETHYDGSIYLWGVTGLTGSDVVATNGSEVYSAVISSGETLLDSGVEITDVQAVTQTDGTVTITFTAPEAGSAGVQYVTGTSGQPMADCYVAEAQRADGLGKVTLTGLTPGQVISYRVYAARTAGVSLTADNDDGFQFSDVYTVRVLKAYAPEKALDATYTGKAYVLPVELPQGATVTYTGDRLNRDGVPWYIGKYTAHITIPAGNDTYMPGAYDVKFEITRIVAYIIPEPNQEKFEGEEDPEFFGFTVSGLLDGDEVWGTLTRKEGEEPGNYAFTLGDLEAEEYYTLRLTRGAYEFTILPGWYDPDVPPLIPGEKLYPVRQEIVRKDGRAVSVVLNTQDELVVTHSKLGGVIYSTADDKNRPVSPILRHNPETDEVLLQLRCQPELNEDGGYVTDASGKPSYGGRYFRLSWLGLRGLYNQGIDSISFSQGGVQVSLRLEDLLSEAGQTTIKELGGDLKQVRFKLTLTPASELTDVEKAAVNAAKPLTDAWRVSVSMVMDKQEIPFEQYLPSLMVEADAEPAAKLLTGMDMYDEATFADFSELMQVNASGEISALASSFVIPFRENELTLVSYPQMMFTHRYYAAPLTQPGVVFLKKK